MGKIKIVLKAGLGVKDSFKQFKRLNNNSGKSLKDFYLNHSKYFFKWRKSLSEFRSPLIDGNPWIVYSAQQYLEKIIRNNMVVFEYGSGGSSVYFLKKVNQVFSVEHDKQWLTKTEEVISSTPNLSGSWEGILIESEKDQTFYEKDILNPSNYFSCRNGYEEKNFSKYAAYIDKFENSFFDIIMIDGRARNSCFLHAKNKLKQGGYLILDNSERSRYNFIHKEIEDIGWKKNDFFGPGPYVNYEFWQTTIWQKRTD